MTVKYRSYDAANITLTIQQVIAWVMIIGGIVGLFNAVSSFGGRLNGQFAALEFGLAVAMTFSAFGTIIGGLLLLAFVQSARANIHTAEMTWEMLEMMRRAEARPSVGNASAASSVSVASSREGASEDYRGFAIKKTDDGYEVSGSLFVSLGEARKFVDSVSG